MPLITLACLIVAASGSIKIANRKGVWAALGVGWRRLCFGEIYERTIICTTITITLVESEQWWLRFVDKM